MHDDEGWDEILCERCGVICQDVGDPSGDRWYSSKSDVGLLLCDECYQRQLTAPVVKPIIVWRDKPQPALVETATHERSYEPEEVRQILGVSRNHAAKLMRGLL